MCKPRQEGATGAAPEQGMAEPEPHCHSAPTQNSPVPPHLLLDIVPEDKFPFLKFWDSLKVPLWILQEAGMVEVTPRVL